MRLFALLAAVLGSAAISGCAVSPAEVSAIGSQSTVTKSPLLGPDGIPTYLEEEYDRGLLEGKNRIVDVERLFRDDDDPRPRMAYAVEVVATTPFPVIVDALRRVYDDGRQCERQIKSKTEKAILSASECSRVMKLIPYHGRRAPLWEAVDGGLAANARSISYSRHMEGDVEDRLDAKYRGYQNETRSKEARAGLKEVEKHRRHLSAVLGVINVASNYAKAPDPRWLSGYQFSSLDASGCFEHAKAALAEELAGKGMVALFRFSTLGQDTSEKLAPWSPRRCDATLQAIPEMKKAYEESLQQLLRSAQKSRKSY